MTKSDWLISIFIGVIICFMLYAHFVLEPKIDALIADEPVVELQTN